MCIRDRYEGDIMKNWMIENSIIFDEKLQDITNLQVREYFSIVRLKAACAALVNASASSKKII